MQSNLENNEKMMPQNSHKVLLIDLENCPSQIKQIQSNIETFSQVVICYAQNSPKIPIDWLTTLAKAINDNKLNIVKMKNGGKNSADFGICFFAGMIMQSLPKETHFVIVSNDTDLDHVVRLLISQGRSAERIGNQKDDIDITCDTDKNASPLGAYCAHLIAHSKNRPSKEETIIKDINNKFKNASLTASGIFKALVSQEVIKIEAGKVTYNDTKIKALANGDHK